MSYERKVCHMCGASGKDLKEEIDRSKILYRIGTYNFMYAKKNVCKKCGYEF